MLTTAQRAAIRRAYRNGQPTKTICADFAISRSTLYRAVTGEKRRMHPTDRVAVLADLATGATKAAVARKYGVKWLTIHRLSRSA